MVSEFIEVTECRNGGECQKIILNTHDICKVARSGSRTFVVFENGEYIYVEETYEELKRKLIGGVING